MTGRNKFLAGLLVAGSVLVFIGCDNSDLNRTSSVSESSTEETVELEESKSEVIVGTLYSPKLGIDWNYDVYLPDGYEENNASGYPVLYMLHGLYGNHRNLLERFNSQEMLDELIEKEDKKAIVIFVDGFNSFYINQKDGMQMETAFMEDLVPYMMKNYNISKESSEHAIGGISMGGYGAARFALKHSDYFSKAILLSPAVWKDLDDESTIKKTIHAFNDGTTNWSKKVYDENFPTNYLKGNEKKVSFYVETSQDDSVVPFDDVKLFVKELENADIPVEFVEDKDDDHNWVYWNKAAKSGYEWTLKEFEKNKEK